jgi:polyketide cyclase/dehydrase/lipid transport protein
MIIHLNTLINRPLDEVFPFVARFENQSRWQAATVQNNQIEPGPMRVGVHGKHVGQWLGRNYESTGEVIAFEPERTWGYKSVSGPYDLSMLYHFQPEDGGTRLSMDIQGDTKGFFGLGRITEPLMKIMAKRMMQSDLARLKRVLEAR